MFSTRFIHFFPIYSSVNLVVLFFYSNFFLLLLAFRSFALTSSLLINRLHEMKIICLPFSVAPHPLFKYNLAVHRFNFGREKKVERTIEVEWGRRQEKWSECIHGIRFGCCYAWILYIYICEKCVRVCMLGLNEKSAYTNTLICSRFCLYHWTFFFHSHTLTLSHTTSFFVCVCAAWWLFCWLPVFEHVLSPNTPAGKNLWRHIHLVLRSGNYTHTHARARIYIYL